MSRHIDIILLESHFFLAFVVRPQSDHVRNSLNPTVQSYVEIFPQLSVMRAYLADSMSGGCFPLPRLRVRLAISWNGRGNSSCRFIVDNYAETEIDSPLLIVAIEVTTN